MKFLLLCLAGALLTLNACTMMKAWRSIPVPGGCEECHKVPISTNWQVSIKPVGLNDERGGLSFQQPDSLMMRIDKPASSIEKQKIEGLACFDCHNAPDSQHKKMKGKFHH